jgi:hypothetical protein
MSTITLRTACRLLSYSYKGGGVGYQEYIPPKNAVAVYQASANGVDTFVSLYMAFDKSAILIDTFSTTPGTTFTDLLEQLKDSVTPRVTADGVTILKTDRNGNAIPPQSSWRGEKKYVEKFSQTIDIYELVQGL